MSQQAAKRRRRQVSNNYTHLAKLGRPIYSSAQSLSVQDSIAREKAKAIRMANASKKK